jgi:hypothetical protein
VVVACVGNRDANGHRASSSDSTISSFSFGFYCIEIRIHGKNTFFFLTPQFIFQESS